MDPEAVLLAKLLCQKLVLVPVVHLDIPRPPAPNVHGDDQEQLALLRGRRAVPGLGRRARAELLRGQAVGLLDACEEVRVLRGWGGV